MLTKTTLMTLLLLVGTGIVKAQLHFIRLVIMAAAGLAGMYMIHLLAQDYNKIANRPAATAAKAVITAGKVLGIFKRSVPDSFEFNIDETQNEIPDFYNILEHDPAGCARKLVCSLATKSQTKLLPEDVNILEMISLSRVGQKAALANSGHIPEERQAICRQNRNYLEGKGKEEFEEAANLGARTKDVIQCEEEYKKCHYSARQLIKIMRTF